MDTNLITALLQTMQGCTPRHSPVFLQCTRHMLSGFPCCLISCALQLTQFSLSATTLPPCPLNRATCLHLSFASSSAYNDCSKTVTHHTWPHSSFRGSLKCHSKVDSKNTVSNSSPYTHFLGCLPSLLYLSV